MLTAEGTFMIGNSIMYLIIKDVESNNLLPSSMTEMDIIQNLVDIWREGPSRIVRMKENRKKVENKGGTYFPEHKHENSNISEENYNNMHHIIYSDK